MIVESLSIVTVTSVCVHFAVRTVLEGLVPIRNIVKVMYLIEVEEERRSNRVYGSIAPSFVKETAGPVEVAEEV